MTEPGFEKVRVLAIVLRAGAGPGANDHWHMRLSAGHETQLGGVIGDLVHADRDKVHQHDFDDRLEAANRGDARRAHERHLGRTAAQTSELQSLMRISYAVF